MTAVCGRVPDPHQLSGMRFLDCDLSAATPDVNAIRLFCGKLTEADAPGRLFATYHQELKEGDYFVIGSRIVGATQAAAPKQCSTQAETAAI